MLFPCAATVSLAADSGPAAATFGFPEIRRGVRWELPVARVVYQGVSGYEAVAY